MQAMKKVLYSVLAVLMWCGTSFAQATPTATVLPTPALSAITGVVLNPDDTPCANCQVNFNPPNNRAQVPAGQQISVFPQAAYTTTDSSGNISAISLIQGTVLVVTISNPNSGGYSANIPVIVPFTNGTSFQQLVGQNALGPATTFVNGFSVGTRTLTPSAANCGGGTCNSLTTDFMLACDASTGNVIYDLPASSGGGRWLDVEKVDSSANTCTLQTAGADTLNGVSPLTLTNQYDGSLINDKQTGKWFINAGTGSGLPLSDITVNKINVLKNNGTDNIGPFNGAESGQINVMDQTGASNSLESISCTVSTPASKQATCSGIGSTAFAAPQYIAMYGAGPNAGVTAPTVAHASPISIYTPGDVDNAHFQATATLYNPYVWCTASSQSCSISNIAMVTLGESIAIPGAGSASGTLNTSITALNWPDNITIANAASTTVNGAHITGANITTSRYYEACALGSNGDWACPNSWTIVANTASALNWGNWVDFQVTAETGALAYALVSASDSSGTGAHLVDIEVPTEISSLNNTNWWNFDMLIYNGPDGGVPKCVPGSVGCAVTTVMLRDVGLGFGYDWNQGGSVNGGNVPATTYAQIFYSQIQSISGNTVTFTTAPTQTGTFTMVHDIGPPINAAIVAACEQTTSKQCGTVYLPPCTVLGCGYREVTPIVAENGQGLKLLCGGNFAAGDLSKLGLRGQTGHIVYSGPLGGTGLEVFNESGFDMENCDIDGLTTMGAGLDIDETPSFTTVTTTSPTLKRDSIGQSAVGLRLANQNTTNVEFGTFQDIYSNVLAGLTSNTGVANGGYGLLDNSGNSLIHQCINCQLFGQIGTWTIGAIDFYGGQSAGLNGVSFWLPSYMADMLSAQNMRVEHVSRVIFGASNSNAYQIQAPKLINDHFTDMPILGDGMVFAFAGGGTAQFEGNWFEAAGTANGDCSSPELSVPNTMVAPWSSANAAPNTTVKTGANIYYGLSTPYAGSGFTNAVYEGGDQYLQSNCSLAYVPVPATSAPTIYTLNSGCSPLYTMSQSANATQAASCTLAAGATIQLQGQTGGADIWGSLDLNIGGQLHCPLWIAMHPNGGTGNASVALGDGYATVPAGNSCDTSSATAGATDIYPDPSTPWIDITNNNLLGESILLRTWSGPN
jgi:hypothetical protein